MDSPIETEKSRKDSARRVYKNPSNYTFNCECGKNFNYRKHYNDHRRKVHKDHSDSRKNPPVKPQKSCPLCEFKSKYRDEMVKHFEVGHDITLVEEKLSFNTKDEFLIWKNRVEKETTSKYISENGSQAFRKHVITKYTCHRSGYYIPHKKKGIRHLKKQGSVKINGFCPANITLHLQNNGSCIIHFISTHIGHDNTLQHLSLTPSEREIIARKLAQKIPFDEILDSIRDSNADTSQQRIHLLTRKDLYNIQASFNLTSKAVKHKSTSVNIDAWVKQMQQIDGYCVLYYKPQGSYSQETPDLTSEDFVLIIASISQLTLIPKHGNECVCVNGIHGVNCCDFELITLMVLDELREGFPCAFLVTNRSDIQILTLFFTQIKFKVGEIWTKIFMSDCSDIYFNAWESVMGIPEKRFYCTWHLDYCWRQNLSKIMTEQKQATMYKHLRTLLTERDMNTFQKLLFQICHIGDPECLDFFMYFNNNFANNSEYWAYCHRLRAGINSNMHLERMHKSISFIYLKEKRPDKGIAAVLKFVREKLADMEKGRRKGTVCAKLANIRLRHEWMEDMDGCTLKTYDHGWEVLSEDGLEMYLVQREEINCSKCELICSECDVCVHQYVCTCLDSAIKYNMCKHIHLVAKSTKSTIEITENSLIVLDAKNDDDSDCDITKDEYDTFLGELNTSSHIPDLDDRKENFIKSIVTIVNSISSLEELEVVESKFKEATDVLGHLKKAVSAPVKGITTDIDLEEELMKHKIKRDSVFNDSKPRYVCSLCRETFNSKASIQSHFETHSIEKKELCEKCGKGFFNKEQLKKHARLHVLNEIRREVGIDHTIIENSEVGNPRTAQVTVSVDGFPNSQFQIPLQIQHIQVSTQVKETNNILSL